MSTYYLIVTDDEPIDDQLDRALRRGNVSASVEALALKAKYNGGRVVAVDMTIRERVQP